MKGGFLRSIALLVVGGGIAQVIALAFSPLVTRLYSPADYAMLTMFLALSGVVIPFACGKYEVAIVVAGTERHASDLTALALRVAAIGSIVLLAPVLAARNQIAELLGCQDLGLWLLAVPVAVLLGAVAMVARYVANRRSEYRIISEYMVAQAALSVALNVLFGWLNWGSSGLLAANLISVGIGTAWLLWRVRTGLAAAAHADTASLRHVAHKYRDFPILNASSTILDALTLAMPVFFIGRIAGQETLGLYGFMMRVAQAPFSLISGAVGQVHLKHLADLIAAGQPASAYLRRITLLLTAIAAPPSIGLMIFAPDLFVFVFGAPWRRAGELLVIMMPSIAIQFVVSTLSPACGVTGHNRLGALWKSISFAVTLSVLLVFSSGAKGSSLFIAISAANVTLYCLYYGFIWYSTANPRSRREQSLATDA